MKKKLRTASLKQNLLVPIEKKSVSGWTISHTFIQLRQLKLEATN